MNPETIPTAKCPGGIIFLKYVLNILLLLDYKLQLLLQTQIQIVSDKNQLMDLKKKCLRKGDFQNEFL